MPSTKPKGKIKRTVKAETNGDEGQGSTEGKVYSCSCGFSDPELARFRRHLLDGGKADGKGTHKSLHTRLAKPLVEKPLGSPLGGDGEHPPPNAPPKAERGGDGNKPARTIAKTGNIREAVRIRVVPREFVLQNSMIFFQAMEAAINLWGWPTDVTPEDFLETYLYKSFKQRGITLGGYAVEEEEKEAVA